MLLTSNTIATSAPSRRVKRLRPASNSLPFAAVRVLVIGGLRSSGPVLRVTIDQHSERRTPWNRTMKVVRIVGLYHIRREHRDSLGILRSSVEDDSPVFLQGDYPQNPSNFCDNCTGFLSATETPFGLSNPFRIWKRLSPVGISVYG